LKVEANRPIPAKVLAAIDRLPGAERTGVRETVTVTAAPPRGEVPGPSQLVELKAIDGEYLYYGTLELEPPRPLAELLTGDSTVVATELLARLGLKVGDDLLVGGRRFSIAGVVKAEPDRVSVQMSIGPRLFLSGKGLDRTGLAAFGSRFDYKVLVKLPAGTTGKALDAAAETLRKTVPESQRLRVETYKQAQPGLRRGIAEIEQFLGLVALLSLFVGGIGVAQSVRAWLAGRLDAIAVLKCLGMRPREIFPLYLGQTALLGLAGSLVGIAAGVAIELALPPLFPDLIPRELIQPWQPAALLRGLLLGVGVAVLFSLPPLSAVLSVPPARVLRRDAEPLPRHRWVAPATVLALALGIWAMASVQADNLLHGLQFTGGVAVVTGLLTAAAWLVARLARRLPREFARSIPLRHGLASLARPGAGTASAIVALGLGVLVVLGMSLVEKRLSAELAAELPQDAPSGFFIDIQPDQWSGVAQILERNGATKVESVPVVTARLSAIDGITVDELVKRDPKNGGRRWALTREQRLTYLDRLPEDNKVVEGKLWSDPQKGEVSLEQEFAQEIGAKLGSTLRFDLQGAPIELAVTSIRTVDWQTFGINFYLIVEPGVLERAPQMRLAVARMVPGSEQLIQDLVAARYPNVLLLRIREMLDKILRIMRRISLGIRFLGGFTVLAGIAILAGAVGASTIRRGREVALLKTLGMTRRGVAAAFAVEYALVGLVAGAIGTLGGTVLAWLILTRGFEVKWELDGLSLGVALVAAVALSVVAGLAASTRALARRPIEVLRGE
jgi:putative ABC transport system permease protein